MLEVRQRLGDTELQRGDSRASETVLRSAVYARLIRIEQAVIDLTRFVRLARAELLATSDSGKLIGAALTGLAAVWRDGYRYKKAGVVLLDLHPASAVQEGLFDEADNPRRVALMRTLDRLNLRFGRDTVSFAAAGCRRPWKMSREFLSLRYTTAWDELLRV
jgi:DNA polymerase V